MHAKNYRHEIEFLIFITALALIWYLGRYFHIDSKDIQQPLKNFPLFYSGILYIILYVVITFCIFFSKDVFWLTGAVLFGAYYSALFISVAETINAFILFYLARRFGRAYVEKRMSQKYKKLDEKLGRVNFSWLFIFRVAPLIPYRFLDLAAGLTKMSFKKYILAVTLGTPLKMFWIQYVLTGVGNRIFKDPNAVVEYFLGNTTLFMLSFIYLLLVILVVLKMRFEE
jgi:uncharacterized membrane protein YdjX (TVP38/TMEM64 family)